MNYLGLGSPSVPKKCICASLLFYASLFFFFFFASCFPLLDLFPNRNLIQMERDLLRSSGFAPAQRWASCLQVVTVGSRVWGYPGGLPCNASPKGLKATWDSLLSMESLAKYLDLLSACTVTPLWGCLPLQLLFPNASNLLKIRFICTVLQQQGLYVIING